MDSNETRAAQVESQVECQVNRLDNTIKRTEELRSILCERLSSVIRTEPTDSPPIVERPELVPLAARLYDQADRLDVTNILLNEIIEETEL